MLGAMGFLLLVLAWIIWRRVLKGPVKLILWTAIHGGKAVSWAVSKKADPNSIDTVAVTSTTTSTVASELLSSAASLSSLLHDEL